MAGNVLEDALQNLDDLGVTDILLPFLLVFVVIFAILQKSKILGEDKKNFNLTFATIAGLLFVIPHATGRYPPESDPVLILNNALPEVSLVLIAVIFILILIGVLGQDAVFLGVTAPAWVMVISITLVTVIFGAAAGWWNNGFINALVDIFGADTLSIVIMLLVFGLIVTFIASDPKEKKDEPGFFGIYPERLYKGK